MKSFIALSLAAVASAAPAFNTETIHGDAAPILSSANAEEVPGAYIIKFKDHVDAKSAADHHSWVKNIHDTWVKTFPENKDERILELRKRGFGLSLSDEVFRGLKHTYKIGSGFVGYAGHFDDSVIEQVRRHPDVSISISTPPAFPSPLPGSKPPSRLIKLQLAAYLACAASLPSL